MKYINLNNSNILNSKLSDDKESNKSTFTLSENREKEKSNREGHFFCLYFDLLYLILHFQKIEKKKNQIEKVKIKTKEMKKYL